MTWHSEASSPSALVCRVAQVLCQGLLPSLISLVLLLLALLVSFPPEPASATGSLEPLSPERPTAPSLSPLFFCFAVMPLPQLSLPAFVSPGRSRVSLQPELPSALALLNFRCRRLLHQARAARLHRRVLRLCLGSRQQILRSFLSLAWRLPLPATCRKCPASPSLVRCKADIAISSSLLRTSVVFESASPKTFSGSVTASSSSSGTPVFLATQPAPTLKERTKNEIRKETRERGANNEPTKTLSGAWIRQSPKMRSSSY